MKKTLLLSVAAGALALSGCAAVSERWQALYDDEPAAAAEDAGAAPAAASDDATAEAEAMGDDDKDDMDGEAAAEEEGEGDMMGHEAEGMAAEGGEAAAGEVETIVEEVEEVLDDMTGDGG